MGLQLFPKYSPAQVKEKMLQWSTKNQLKFDEVDEDISAETKNRLLYIPTVKVLKEMQLNN